MWAHGKSLNLLPAQRKQGATRMPANTKERVKGRSFQCATNGKERQNLGLSVLAWSSPNPVDSLSKLPAQHLGFWHTFWKARLVLGTASQAERFTCRLHEFLCLSIRCYICVVTRLDFISLFNVNVGLNSHVVTQTCMLATVQSSGVNTVSSKAAWRREHSTGRVWSDACFSYSYREPGSQVWCSCSCTAGFQLVYRMVILSGVYAWGPRSLKWQLHVKTFLVKELTNI